MKAFTSPQKTLGDLDVATASNVIMAATDVALILDSAGIIQDLAFHNAEFQSSLGGTAAWLGQPWKKTVTLESQAKIDLLMRDATNDNAAKWRHINHFSEGGLDIPVLYSTVKVRTDGNVVALGRDLRAVATLQQQLVETQQSLERDYARLRFFETRYRLLFELSPEGLIILDALTLRILEANSIATKIFASLTIGESFTGLITVESAALLQTGLGQAQSAGFSETISLARLGTMEKLRITVHMFRQEQRSLFLLRTSVPNGEQRSDNLPTSKSRLLQLIDTLPDGFVVTENAGRVLSANNAFLEMAELASEEMARGATLDRWLGRPGADLTMLLATLRQHHTVRLFQTQLNGEYGSRLDVEISAVSLASGDQDWLGFTIRNVGRRLTAEPAATRTLPRSVAQLTELVGRVSLKDLVRETTDVIERLCIEAALEITGDNRAAAADMLGLSRQSLYMKLRRFGLADLGNNDDGDE